MSAARRFLIIHNKDAGKGRRGLLHKTVALLERFGASVTLTAAASLAQDTKIAAAAVQEGGFDVIAAAGGDSTVRGVAAGLMDSTVPLGIIPVGTGNVLAREIGLPRKSAALARHLMSQRHIRFTLGTADDQPFCLMTGIGFDALVAEKLSHALKLKLGKAAYGPAIARTLIENPRHKLTLSIDGSAYHADWAIFTNVGRYGGAFRLTNKTSFQQPGLRAILFQAKNRRELIGHLMKLLSGRIDQGAEHKSGTITSLPCSKAIVTAQMPVPLQIDGEPAGTTPVTITTAGQPIQILVP